MCRDFPDYKMSKYLLKKTLTAGSNVIKTILIVLSKYITILRSFLMAKISVLKQF